jgi:hypothetical protein
LGLINYLNKIMNKQQILELGYHSPKLINGIWCALQRMAFTTGLFVDIDEFGYSHRYCYHTLNEAKEALVAYEDTDDHPSGNWIKRKGKVGDLANPIYQKYDNQS